MGRIWDRRRKNKGGETLTLAVEGAQCGRQGETASNWSSVMRNAHEFVRDPWGGRLSMGMDDAFPSEGFTFFSLFGLGGLNFFIFYFLIFFFFAIITAMISIFGTERNFLCWDAW